MSELSDYEKWKRQLAIADREMPRYIEDLITGYGTEGLPEILLNRYMAKRQLRDNRPFEE